jgi:hypothetical protein
MTIIHSVFFNWNGFLEITFIYKNSDFFIRVCFLNFFRELLLF